MKQGWNIFSRIVGFIVVLFIAATMAIENPKVQNKIAAKAIEALNASFGASVSYSSIRIRPFNIVLVDDLLLLDKNPYIEDRYGRGWAPADTFIFARKVRATVSPLGLFKGEGLHIKRAMLDGIDFHIVTEPDRERSDNLSRIFGGEEGPNVPHGGPNIFDIREVDIRNFRFRLTNFKPKPPAAKTPEFGINYDDLDVRCNRVRAHSLKRTGGRISFSVDEMDMHEKSGYDAWNVKGNARIGFGKVEVFNFHLKDLWSDFRFHKYSMTFDKASDFKDFVNKVTMELTLKECHLGMMTISHFADIIPRNNLFLDIKDGSHAIGTVNDMEITSIDFTETTSGIKASLSAHAKGLEQSPITLARSDIRRFSFTSASLERFLKAIDPSIRADIKGLAPGIPFNFSGKTDGPLSGISFKGKLTSGIGEAETEGLVSNLGISGQAIRISGTAGTKNLDIGKIIGAEALGKVTLEAHAGADISREDSRVTLESLFVDRMELLGYEYSNIYGSGTSSKESAEAKLTIDDPCLNLTAEGTIDYSDKSEKRIKAIANLALADLDAMNIDKRGKSSKVACKLSADFSDVLKQGLNGGLRISDIVLEDDYGVREAGDIFIETGTKKTISSATLTSDFLDASYYGSIPFDSIVAKIEEVTSRRHLSSLYSSSETPRNVQQGGDFSLSVDFHDSRNILSFILPGLYIADSTRFSAGIDQDGIINGGLNSQRLAFGKNYIKDLELCFDNLDSSLNVTLTGSKLKAGLLTLKDAALSAYAKDNSSAFSIHLTDDNNEDNYGEFYLNADFERTPGDTLLIRARPMSSYVKLTDSQWQTTETDIVYRKGSIKIGDFSISNGAQSLFIKGGASKEGADTLSLTVHDIDLEISKAFTSFLKDVRGKVNGEAYLYSPLSEGINLMADLGLKELFAGSEEIGEIRVVGSWDTEEKRFNAFLANNLGSSTPMNAHGWFRPSDSTIDFSARMDRFKLASAAPFLSSVFSEVGGYLSGNLNVNGPVGAPEISSEGMRLDGARLKVAFTGVPYYIDGPLSIDSKGLRFASATIRDEKGGIGALSGGLSYDKFSDIMLDARINAEKLEVLNLKEGESESIHGHLFADADLSVNGPLDDITISGVASTVDRGDINIELGNAVAANSNKLLTFKEPPRKTDPYEEMLIIVPEKKKNRSNLNIKVRAGAGNGTTANFNIDKSSGNTVSAYGEGNVDLDLSTATGRMNLAGDYNLSGGKYRFEIPGVLGIDFNIRSGSFLKFAGDIMDTEVSLDAVYNVKTSLSSLLADTSSISSRRNVECLINISGRLRNPELQFGINIPDLDPTTKSRVQAALNTEDKVQQQFVSLLVIGSFLPGEQSGVFNGGNVLYSNVGSIMASQVNSILQQLNIPLDLDLGYQQVEDGTNIFDVAVSTQLFNNRLEVAGSLGNRKYSATSATQSDVVGDVDIEYKINPAGTFRLKAFSHSADEFSSFLDYSQRNGIGVSFQKGFDTFRQLIRNLFSPRKERGENAARREEEQRRLKTITLDE